MSCKRLLALAAALGFATASANAQILYTEDFDDSAGATRWSAPIEAQEDPNIAFDGSTDYAFDYSVWSIPASPNGNGSTIGLFQETNTTDQCPTDPNCTDSDEGEATGVFSNYALPSSGSYKVTADLYLFWNGGGGSTEYASFGVGHDGSDNTPLRFGLNDGDGIAWQIDTDGDSGTDIIRFDSVRGQTGLGGYEDIPNGTIPGVPTGATSPIGVANQWVEVAITVTSAGSTFSINDVVIDSWLGDFGGSILLGQSDPFNSVNPPAPPVGASNGAIWDNVVVSVIPEPTSGLIAAVAMIGLGLRRRV
ncbi:MAG: PEP-CTERM sorting domain-containing protein [Planctomycetota bacterium]